jgi:hypothetical protein
MSNATNVIFSALQTRFAACLDFGLVNQVDAMNATMQKTSVKLLDLAQSKLIDTDFDNMVKRIETVNENGIGLDQVKTIDKIVRLLNAVALDLESGLCNYMKYTALSTLQNGDAITVRETVCALSRVAHKNSDIFAVREGFKNLAGYSIGTGNSQASQCRQVFNTFGFYTAGSFNKGKTEDKPELSVYGKEVLTKLVYKNS